MTTHTAAPPRRPGGGSPLTGRQRFANFSYKATPYVYISPFFILFAIVGLFPLLYTAYVSLHQWSLIGGDGGWIAFDNYAAVLGDKKFWIALRNSVSIFLLSSVPQIILALLIASALDTNLRGKTFWRMGVLLPYVVAPVAVALIFGQLFADQFGAINNLLGTFGIDPYTGDYDLRTSTTFEVTGWSFPFDDVTVEVITYDPAIFCFTTADADGRWSCEVTGTKHEATGIEVYVDITGREAELGLEPGDPYLLCYQPSPSQPGSRLRRSVPSTRPPPTPCPAWP